MSAPEILGTLASTYTRAICMLCIEKDIDYVLIETGLRAPVLFTIHPQGKMPVLRHGNFSLFESKAIATYLDLAFAGPRLIPPDPRGAALTEQWISFVNAVVDRTLVRTYVVAYIAAMRQNRRPDADAIEAMLPDIRSQIGILDQAVARTGFLVGDALTFADLNLLPILHRFQQPPEGNDILRAAPHLAAYYERHAARNSFRATLPPDGPPPRG